MSKLSLATALAVAFAFATVPAISADLSAKKAQEMKDKREIDKTTTEKSTTEKSTTDENSTADQKSKMKSKHRSTDEVPGVE